MIFSPSERLAQCLETRLDDDMREKFKLQGDSGTWFDAMALAQLERALHGDTAAFKAICELAYPEDYYSDEIEFSGISASLKELAEELEASGNVS